MIRFVRTPVRWLVAFAALAAVLLLAPTPARAVTEAEARSSLERGLEWLVDQQNENGSFGVVPNAPEPGEVGITALAITSIAGAPPELRERWSGELQAAVDWLLTQRTESGSFTTARAGLDTYRTSIAILALLAVDPDLERYREEVLAARDLIASIQMSGERGLEDVDEPRQNPHFGGWGYDRSGTEPGADLSNTQFALIALRKADLPEDSPVWDRVRVFLSRCQNRSESNDVPELAHEEVQDVVIGDDGGFMYDPGLRRNMSPPRETGEGVRIPSYGSMSYAGLLSMIHADLERDDPRIRAALGWIRRNYTLERNTGLGTREEGGKQGLYYMYLTMARALDAWGERWLETETEGRVAWARDLLDELVDRQHDEGYWVNTAERWWENDPVLVTCYVTRAMELALANLPADGEAADGASTAPPPFTREELANARMAVVHRLPAGGERAMRRLDAPTDLEELAGLVDMTAVDPPGEESHYRVVLALPDGRTAHLMVGPTSWNFQRRGGSVARRDPDGRLHAFCEGLFE